MSACQFRHFFAPTFSASAGVFIYRRAPRSYQPPAARGAAPPGLRSSKVAGTSLLTRGWCCAQREERGRLLDICSQIKVVNDDNMFKGTGPATPHSSEGYSHTSSPVPWILPANALAGPLQPQLYGRTQTSVVLHRTARSKSKNMAFTALTTTALSDYNLSNTLRGRSRKASADNVHAWT